MGFLSNMFNLKTKYVDEPDSEADIAPQKSTKAFYLDPDSAKTLKKNAQPVRDSSSENKVLDTTSEVVKDTQVEEVAPAIESQATVDQVAPSSETISSETTSSDPGESTSTDGGPTDDGMDMFRNMARNMKRR